jgi:hypothetical protein
MPTKAEVTTEDALSINSSTTLNLNSNDNVNNSNNNNSNNSNNTNQNVNGSVLTLKSQIPTKIQSFKSQSGVNEKFSRFDGGEQQIIVIYTEIKFGFFFYSIYFN